MKSDLEIENAASLPLRGSLAGHNPVWHHTRFQTIGIVARKFVHYCVPEGDGPDAEGVAPELVLSDPPEGAIAAAHIAAISARASAWRRPQLESTPSLAQPRGNAVLSE